MSPGNLYRYFPSKEALIAGIAERDRAEVAQEFASADLSRGFFNDKEGSYFEVAGTAKAAEFSPDLPAADREQIVDRFQAKHNREPTEAEIVQAIGKRT